MGFENVYQTKYDSTIDTLALRDNVKKILQNAAVKTNAAAETYQPSYVVETLNKHEDSFEKSQELKSTINFLNSKAAMKLLNLTKRPQEQTEESYADIIELNIDESKKNIFAA